MRALRAAPLALFAITIGMIWAEGPAAPKKGDTVYIARILHLQLFPSELAHHNIPYDKLHCPGTRDCRYKLTWCSPVNLRKQDSARTRIQPPGLMTHTLVGDFRHLTFLDRASCDAAFIEALQAATIKAAPQKQ
jgi:hypothetical protein